MQSCFEDLQRLAAVICLVLLFAAAIADEAEPVEACSEETNAVAQAVVDYMIAEASAHYQMDDVIERGYLHMYRMTFRPECALENLAHDAVQIVLIDEEQHNDLARNLRGASALRIVGLNYLDDDVADVHVAALLSIAHETYIDRSLGCGKRLYLSKSDGVWKVDVDRGGVCS